MCIFCGTCSFVRKSLFPLLHENSKSDEHTHTYTYLYSESNYTKLNEDRRLRSTPRCNCHTHSHKMENLWHMARVLGQCRQLAGPGCSCTG